MLPSTVESTRQRIVRETGAQKCQVVDVEVVAVALRSCKSANYDLMEWLFYPTLNHKSAEVGAVRQMYVSKNNHGYNSNVCVHTPVRIVILRLSSRRYRRSLLFSLSCVTATGRPELVFCILSRTCAGTSGEVVVVTVAMIAMTKNPTKKTPSKVTMSMMTTMTTVLHRVLENDR